jgi:nitrogen PTS system EIIA component
MELSLREVAHLLDVSEETIDRWVRQRELPAVRVGGQYRVNKVELQEWAAARNLRVSAALYAPAGKLDALPSLYTALELGQIHYDLPGTERYEVLAAAAQLPSIPRAVDRQLLFELLVGREQLASTGIGSGIAIPHPRDPLVVQIDEPVVILAFLEHKVDFEAVDSLPVEILFMLLSPSVRAHLQMLSLLMFALHDDLVKELLARRMPADAIMQRISEIERKFMERQSSAPKVG